MNKKFDIPKEIVDVVKNLKNKGFEAFLVGGCVRDLFLEKKINDWDITTNANPDEIQEIFEHTFYENDFGTVGVVNDSIKDEVESLENELENLKNQEKEAENEQKSEFFDKISEIEQKIAEKKVLEVVEVTPYRVESTYSDNRRPDEVKFSKKLEDDLKRRDFTINALCFDPVSEEFVDLFGGVSDLQNRIIKTVGESDERFEEDSLRILRAVRFSAQLDFEIEEETRKSILKNKDFLKNISKERIRDEFIKILMTKNALKGIFLAKDLEVLKYISQDLVDSIGVSQNGAHVYDVFEHLVRTMQHAVDKDWSLIIRLAGLFHDISKPETKRFSKEKNDFTFYGHEVLGAKRAKKNLKDLKFDTKTIDTVTILVRWHMFFSDPDKITLSAVRRIIRNVGKDNVWNLIKLRICDRIGMGRPKEKSYRLRQYVAMMEGAMRSPISVKDLKVNGDIFIKELGMKPGRRIGLILNALMGITLFEPEKNNYDFLMEKTKEFMTLEDEELIKLANIGKEKIEEEEKKEIRRIHRKNKIK